MSLVLPVRKARSVALQTGSNPASTAKTDAATSAIKKRYRKLVFELLSTALDHLSNTGPDQDPFTSAAPTQSQLESFRSAFRAAGFSREYADQEISAALVRYQMHRWRQKRRRRLIMFEKRVRQVADTVKRMAADGRRKDGTDLSWAECRAMVKAAETSSEVQDPPCFDKDDQKLVAELESLLKEGKKMLSRERDSPVSSRACDDQNDHAPRSALPAVESDEPDKWVKQAGDAGRNNISQINDGLGWDDLLPEHEYAG